MERQSSLRLGVLDKLQSFRMGSMEKQKSFRSRSMDKQQSFRERRNKESPGKRGDTELHLAARAGSAVHVQKILSECGEDSLKELVSKQNVDGETALYVAAEKGHVEVVHEILQVSDVQSAAVKASNSFDAFHIAAKQGHLEVLKELLYSFPALAMTTNSLNSTALDTAATQGHIDIVNLLLETDASLAKIARNNGKTVLHSAARMGHVEVVKSLLNKDPSIGLRTDKKGQTAFHMAVKGQNVDIVLELLKPDASIIHLDDNKGNKPLHIATRKGNLKVLLALLVIEGIDINAVNKAGETALAIAEKCDHIEIAAVLREVGAVTAKENSNPPNPAKQLKQTVSDIKHDVHFGMLAPDLIDSSDENAACAAICERMGLKGYQIGKTKVFLRAGQMAELDARRTEVLANAVRRIQRQIRTHLARKEFITLRKASIQLQKFWRARLARKLYEHLRREDASISIQKYARSHTARKAYTQLQAAAIVIQTGLRAMAARNEYRHRRRTKAAIIIQTQWRLHKAYLAYKQQKKATLALQCLWRARLARKELRKLKMAARETGALKEAKDKLEKRVEELTWRLEFEKHLRIDLEEAKVQEIAKLQTALQEMQEKLNEANAAIIREKEAAKITIEQAPPVIKEVPVVDNTKLDLLTNHNKELEDELNVFKSKAEEFEERYSEVQKEAEALLKDTEKYQSKISQLQEMIESRETNLSNLESENQVLRQQALVASTNEDQSGQIKSLESKIATLESENQVLRSRPAVAAQPLVIPELNQPPIVKSIENGHQEEKDHKVIRESLVVPVASALSKQKSLTDRQQENHDALIKCLMEDKRFDKKRPAAACIVYKSLLQWHSFEAEKTNIFDRIIHTIKSSFENQENVGELAYWLSTASTILLPLQNNLKANSASNTGSNRSRTTLTLFSRMARNSRPSSSGMEISSGYSGIVGKSDSQSRIVAKYPALLFKQHLTACVEKIYGMIRDSLKKEISPFLTMCIQAPRCARVRSIRGSSKSIHSNIVAKQASSMHWQSIVKSLDRTLEILIDNYVPSMIIKKTFSQVFAYINLQLFNSLLLRRECCSFSNGEFVKAGLHDLEQWCRHKAMEECAETLWDELQHIRQAVGFLVLHQKSHKSLEEITNELCPILSIPQIYRIGTMFWDDKYCTQGLSKDVIGKMRAMTTDDSINMPNNSFLLDDDSSIPFSLDDLSRSVADVGLSDVEPPPLLRQNSEFHFLLQQQHHHHHTN